MKVIGLVLALSFLSACAPPRIYINPQTGQILDCDTYGRLALAPDPPAFTVGAQLGQAAGRGIVGAFHIARCATAAEQAGFVMLHEYQTLKRQPASWTEVQANIPREAAPEASRKLAENKPTAQSKDEAPATIAKVDRAEGTLRLETKSQTIPKYDQGSEPTTRGKEAVVTTKTPHPAKVFYVTQADAKLYARQWDYTKVIATLEKGEAVVLLGQAFGNDGVLYNVKTQKGLTGWVRSGDVTSKP